MGKFNDMRKNSWESKLSNGTIEGYHTHNLSPSSILSSNSDITFTTKKLNSQLRCGCYIIASLLCFLLFCAISVYTGYTYFISQRENEQIFRVQFRVIDGDRYTQDLTNSSSNSFRIRARDYKERLNLLFRRSSIKYGFSGIEILALDGNSRNELVVHFNVKLDTRYLSVEASDIIQIIQNEIASKTDSLYFNNLVIDPNSLNVIEYCDQYLQEEQSLTTSETNTVSKTTTYFPQICTHIQLNLCSNILQYNYTSYPNYFGHNSDQEVINDIITFRELIDSECYSFANDFLCKLLQPNCQNNNITRIQSVCRHYCREFIQGCGSRLPVRLKNYFDCSRFPEFLDDNNCLSKSNCIKDLKKNQMCDGVFDCHDLSDERYCSYCSKNEIHCGFGKKCIPENARCDGKIDCPNASDERLCLTLVKNFSQMILKPERNLMPYSLQYNPNGIVVFNEKGHFGKLCADNLFDKDIKPIAISLCQSLTFKSYSKAKIEKNLESIITQYVQVSNITKSEIKFERTQCEGKKILHVQCENFSCGLLPIKFQSQENSNIYWPWHVTLFKDNVHICDATLITSNWILTTISCFQGQGKAEWIANFGTNRLHSSPPWISERHIVGMVKSPIEGSSIVLLKLEYPVILSDFIRPICLSKNVEILQNSTNCYTLGWSQEMQKLQTVPVTFRNMNICENISIKNTNSICAENENSINNCNIEEFTGTSLICLSKNNLNWNLIGISNWRIACSSLVTERPRLYDKVSSNIEWIEKTIHNL